MVMLAPPSSGGYLQHAGGGGVADDVIGGSSRDASRQGAGASAAGLAVDQAEINRIAYLKVQVRLNGDFVIGNRDASYRECAGGASRFVVKGAGRTGQDSDGHFVNGSGCAQSTYASNVIVSCVW